MQKMLRVPEGHIIVDQKDWERAREFGAALAEPEKGSRGKHGQQPNKVNFEDLVGDLCYGTYTLRMLELAYREYIRRNPSIPEGAKDLLVGREGAGMVSFASHIGGIVGGIELSYRRGMQVGKAIPLNKTK